MATGTKINTTQILKDYSESLKDSHERLEESVLAAVPEHLVQPTSIAFQQFAQNARGAAREAFHKNDIRGVVQAGLDRLKNVDDYINANPDIKQAVDAQKGRLTTDEFTVVRGGKEYTDRSASYQFAHGGDMISLDPNNLPDTVSDYSFNHMGLNSEYKNLAGELGIDMNAPAASPKNSQTQTPAYDVPSIAP